MIDKYLIPKYLEFLSRHKFSDAKSYHAANTASLYYEFACYQMLSLSNTFTDFFKVAPEDHDGIIEYLHKSWAYAYGMYALLRTSLEAIRIMKKMIGDDSAPSSFFDEHIKRIIDIANDIVKHPTFKPTANPSWAVEPQALSLNGEIDIIVWSDTGESMKIELNPMKDFEIVREYLEHIGAKLGK